MRENDIRFFKQMLEERREQILKNIEGSSKELDELHESHDVMDEGDIASVSADNLINEEIMASQQKELEEIDEALGKISQGVYGVCEMCEEPIGMQRLKVKPFAKYCITCRQIAEKSPA
ncbi:RNA polymerase-binding protein DksA [Hydrogenimonas thermophila]|uniref:Transcriptional regulator, TraR/DksA family n=1 Tax=Hydrogenimonas thermophila TaxID=223786 RepID=A0A1I5MJP2_9BACT|nr:RNA polymerase-binding protein DksA [Hydrogenimonas thermophila]WOE70904.1 RNA polymerase-binding protein DksA [Hydrogenimonas thermophila]WOE73422.1 RNA polymerase-binding protein DksA [Hydrogenimonas thermophila]SFP09151.1 transcriptional regulator, TraR/DksA family [Hydrogenimonas thermophila]